MNSESLTKGNDLFNEINALTNEISMTTHQIKKKDQLDTSRSCGFTSDGHESIKTIELKSLSYKLKLLNAELANKQKEFAAL